MTEHRGGGAAGRPTLDEALDRLRDAVVPVDGDERVPVATAVGRVLAVDLRVPEPTGGAASGPADAVTPAGSDDRTPADRDGEPRSESDDETGDEGGDENGGKGGDETGDGRDGEAGDGRGTDDGPLLAAGRRIRESDLGICRALGYDRLRVTVRPSVGVVPVRGKREAERTDSDEGDDAETGDAGGDTVVTDDSGGTATAAALDDAVGLTVGAFVDRWGGKPTVRDPVEPDRHALRAALQRDLTRDVVVVAGETTGDGGDPVPPVVDELGELLVESVAIDPGQAAAIGVVRETPVVVLPPGPLATLVTAVQLACPAVERAGRRPVTGEPGTEARLGRAIESDPDVRTFAPVSVGARLAGADGTTPPVDGGGPAADGPGEGLEIVAEPFDDRDDPLGVLAAHDGWVVVPEARERFAAGETVRVTDWEARP